MRDSFSDKLWQFDSHFNSLLFVFDEDWMDAVMMILSREFEERWDSDSIKNASKPIKKLVKSLYGIESGQFIFSIENNDHDMALFAAWWPWGNNEKASLRISIFSPGQEIIDDGDVKKYLMEWFSLE